MTKEISFKEYEKEFNSPSSHMWWNNSVILFQHYQGLIEYVEKVAFPERVGRYHPPKMDGWSKVHKCLYWYSNPLGWFISSKRLLALSYTWLSFYIILFWLIGGMTLFFISYGEKLSSIPSQSLEWFDYVVSGFFLLATFVLIPAAYIRWSEFIVDKRYSKLFRIIFSLFVITGSVTFSLWLYSFRYNPFSGFFHSPENILGFTLAYILFFIPAFSFGLLLLMDSYMMLGDQIRSLFTDLYTLHYPLSFELISKVLYNQIEDKTTKWKLADLAIHELSAIQKWADANRDSSEKRVTPAIVLVAVIGLLANTQPFAKLISKIYSFILIWFSAVQSDFFGLNSGLSIQSIIYGFIFISFALALILFLVFLFSSIFRNLIVQSVIIEACIIAEFAAKEANDQEEKDLLKSEDKSWWQLLLHL